MLYIGLLHDTKEKKIGEADNDYIHAHYLFIEKRWLLKRNTGCLREDFYKATDSWGGVHTTFLFARGRSSSLSVTPITILAYHTPGLNLFLKEDTPRTTASACGEGRLKGRKKKQRWEKYLSHLTKLICLCHEPSSGSQLYCFPLVLPPTLSYTAGKKKRILAFMGLLFLVTRQKYIYPSLWQTEVELLPPFKCQYKPQLLPFKIC